MLSDQTARQSANMIKKTSGILLLCLLRSTLCIPLSQFYPFGDDAESNSDRLTGGNSITEKFNPDNLYWFYGQFISAATVSYLSILDITYSYSSILGFVVNMHTL